MFILKNSFNDEGQEEVVVVGKVTAKAENFFILEGEEYSKEEGNKKVSLKVYYEGDIPSSKVLVCNCILQGEELDFNEEGEEISIQTARASKISRSRRVIIPVKNPKNNKISKKNIFIGEFIVKKNLYSEKKNFSTDEDYVRFLQGKKSFSGSVVVETEGEEKEFYPTNFIAKKWDKNPNAFKDRACKFLSNLKKGTIIAVVTGDEVLTEWEGKTYKNYFAKNFQIIG